MRAASLLPLLPLLCSSVAAQAPDYAGTFAKIGTAAAAQLPELKSKLRADYAQTNGGRDLVDGLIAFREYELTLNPKRANDSETLLERARSAAPENPWLQYAYALAIAHGPRIASNGPALRETGRAWSKELGLDPYAKAKRAAERTLELDSLHTGAAVIYGELALLRLEQEPLEKAERALWRVSQADASAALTLARVQNQIGSRGEALAAAQRAVALDSNSVGARLELANSLLLSPGREAEGAREYFEAVGEASTVLAERLFNEVRPIATPGDSARWRALAPAQRQAWFEQFWAVRAAMSAVSVPTRLAEHYRRLTFALREYPHLNNGPVSEKALLRQKSTLPVDQRGELYIRHGPPWKKFISDTIKVSGEDLAPACDLLGYDPMGEAWRAYAGDQHDRRVRITLNKSYSAPPSEVWAYQTDAGTELHALLRCPGSADYVIPYDLPCKLLAWGPEIVQQSYDIHRCGAQTPERRRVLTREALRTDSYKPPVDQHIPVDFDMLAFRGTEGRTDLLIPVALDTDSLRGSVAPGGYRYSVRLVASVIDTAAQRVEQSDTTIRLIAPGVLTASRVSLHTQVSARPTKEAFFRLRVDNAEIERHSGTAAQHVRVPSYVGDTLMISDVVLGAAVEGGNFQRGGRRVSLLPFAHSVDGRFRVFYEIYNLPRAAPYKTQLLVERRGGAPQDGIRLEFEDEGQPDDDGVVRVLRTMGTELRAGEYRITLRVILRDNHFVEKTRGFIVGT